MKRKAWTPPVGEVVQYRGKSTLSRNGHTARVVSTARNGHYVVEVIGSKGLPVNVTVHGRSLFPLESLF